MYISYDNSVQTANFKAQFSKKAQAYINKGLSEHNIYTKNKLSVAYKVEYYKFMNDLIKQIKAINPEKYTIIDINAEGDRFLCNTFASAEDINKDKVLGSMVVSNDINGDFLSVLLDLKEGMFKCSQIRDKQRHFNLQKLFNIGQM